MAELLLFVTGGLGAAATTTTAAGVTSAVTGSALGLTGLSTAAGVLGTAGMAMQAIGALQQGQAASSAAKYNAQIARQNAILARQKATEDERRFRVGARKQLGAIRAGYGAAGVTMEGAPSDILEESAYIAELDALSIRQGGRQEAGAYESEARLAKLQGKQAKKQSYFGAASALLKGGSNLYQNWPS